MTKKKKMLTQDELIKKLLVECPLLEEEKVNEFLQLDREFHIKVSEFISSILAYMEELPRKYPEANDKEIQKCCAYLAGIFLSAPSMIQFVDMIQQDDLRIMLHAYMYQFKASKCHEEALKLQKKKK